MSARWRTGVLLLGFGGGTLGGMVLTNVPDLGETNADAIRIPYRRRPSTGRREMRVITPKCVSAKFGSPAAPLLATASRSPLNAKSLRLPSND